MPAADAAPEPLADAAPSVCDGFACAANAACEDQGGVPVCRCDAGFEGDGAVGGAGCADIDECARGIHGCVAAPAGGTCENTEGSWMCGCSDGFTGDGVSDGLGCNDIDECALATDDCGTVSDCVNEVGTFHCAGLVVVSTYRRQLRQLDPATFGVVSSTVLAASGVTITGANGLAVHPATGEAFAIVRVDGQSGRSLAVVDTTTGGVTIVGNTGGRFAAIAFGGDGTLYAVTGNGGTPAETLFSIDTETAAVTQLIGLGAGSDGEALAFDPDDGMLYHASGRDTNPAFERIDVSGGAPVVTSISRSGFNYDEVQGLGWNPGAGALLAFNIDQEAIEILPGGAAASLGSIDDGSDSPFYKGIAFGAVVPPQRVSPAAGSVDGGTALTILGVGFGQLTAPTIHVGGVAATGVSVIDDNTITATTPAHAAGSVDIEIFDEIGGATRITARRPGAFTYE